MADHNHRNTHLVLGVAHYLNIPIIPDTPPRARQDQQPDRPGPPPAAPATTPALSSQTVTPRAASMLVCDNSSYGCAAGARAIDLHRFQVLKCSYGDRYYLFWKDSAPPAWDAFINGHAFTRFGRVVLSQCPPNGD